MTNVLRCRSKFTLAERIGAMLADRQEGRLADRRRKLAAARAAKANAAAMGKRYGPSVQSNLPAWFITGADLD